MAGFLQVHDLKTSQNHTIPMTGGSVRGFDLARIKGPIDGDNSALPRGNGLVEAAESKTWREIMTSTK